MKMLGRVLRFIIALLIGGWVLVPFYLAAVAVLTPREALAEYPKQLVPSAASLDALRSFVDDRGIFAAIVNSAATAAMTAALSLALGAPAGYALARLRFPGRRALRGAMLTATLFPFSLLAVPIAPLFARFGLFDNLGGLALIHTAVALPFVALLSARAFAAKARDGVGPPPAMTGLLAATAVALLLSWNEVFAASVLTLQTRTLPAVVLGSLSTSPLGFKIAAAVTMALPALVLFAVGARQIAAVWGDDG